MFQLKLSWKSPTPHSAIVLQRSLTTCSKTGSAWLSYLQAHPEWVCIYGCWGWLVHIEAAAVAAVCPQDLVGKRLTFAIKGRQSCCTLREVVRWETCTGRTCAFVYVYVQGNVYSWCTVFCFLSKAGDLLEEKAGEKKMKGRETFLSVSHLSCDARWVLFLWLFRKAGGRWRWADKKTKQREAAKWLNVQREPQNYSLSCYSISLRLAFFWWLIWFL